MTAETIDPFLFEYEGPLPSGELVTYVMPLAAYEALKAAQEQPSHYSADIRGLEAVLAWAAPSVDACAIANIEGQPGKSLHLWCYEPQRLLKEVQEEVNNALALWIGLAVGPEHADKIQKLLLDGRTVKTAWRSHRIDGELLHHGACPVPKDPQVFNLLTVMAGRTLEGLNLPGHAGSAQRKLLATAPGESLYSGKTLIGHHPNPVERKSGPGHWTELLRVATMTTPEQSKLRIGVGVSIRNYVSIHPASFKFDFSRTLDVFLAPDAFLSKASTRMRALSIPLQRRDLHALAQGNEKSASPALAVLRKILAINGISESSVIDERGQLISHSGRKASLMPCAGSYYGDRWLPGETGVGAPDRENYLELIKPPLEAAGFRAVHVHRRTPKRLKSFARLEKAEDPEATLQKLVLDQVQALNRSDTLHVAVLSPRPQARDEVEVALGELLGEPKTRSKGASQYACGLKVQLHGVDAGPFATRLPDAAAAVAAQKIPESRRAQVERAAARDNEKVRMQELKAHLDRVLPKDDAIWIGLLEMDTRLRDEPAQDPYLLSYQALAQRNILPQAVLFDPESPASKDGDDESESSAAHKLRSSLRDLLRCLGVVYMDPQSYPKDLRVQGWWIANFNANYYDRRPGARRDKLLLPMAVQLRGGQLFACVPSAAGSSAWQPYAKALLALRAGDVYLPSDTRMDAQRAFIGQFFGSLLNEPGANLTFCDATNLRQFLPALTNGKLRFGEMAVGQVGAAEASAIARDGEASTIVRLLHDPDKAPAYHVPDNSSGITTGIFAEEHATRTYWLSRGLPISLQKSPSIRIANKSSRYDEEDKNLKARRFPSLTEVCIPVLGKDRQADEVMALTRKAMQLHASTDEATILPFPLHEADLLAQVLK